MDTGLIQVIIGIAYLIMCFAIEDVAEKRGHKLGAAFLTSLLCTPLIGAILYSHYKPK